MTRKTGERMARFTSMLVDSFQHLSLRSDPRLRTNDPTFLPPRIRDATTVRADQPHLRPGGAAPSFGYGYQTWILPGERRMFFFWGARGQRIYVDPQGKLVMVNTAVHGLSVDVPRLKVMDALWWALVHQLGG
jgi:CubicO group peptidase (beta-lactamase class C family)